MRILNQNDYQIININHPRYKNIEVIQFDNQIWFNLNDLCQNVGTTKSAINSLDEGSPHLVYIQHPGNEDHIPFVNEQGFLLAETGRTQAYKSHILNWAYNELKEPILPTIDQMIVLAGKTKSTAEMEQPHHNLINPQKNASNAPQRRRKAHRCYVPKPHSRRNALTSLFQAYDYNCNISELVQRYQEEGINYKPYQFLSWLLKYKYISCEKSRLYRPLFEYYDRGYFVDNRNTFNSFYPQRDILFTPKGQRYFFEKLTAEK